MKKVILIALFALLPILSAAGSVRDTTITDFKEVAYCVSQKVLQYGEKNVLIVLDIENTISTSYVDLGGDKWYLGQGLTDPMIPSYIKKWQDDKITVFALTARSPANRTATERELIRNGIDFSKSPLKTVDGNTVIYDYELERSVSYQNGIMMVTGMDKGKMLAHILEKSGLSFKAIIFVDDTEINIDSVRKEFADKQEVDLNLFRYEKVISDRK